MIMMMIVHHCDDGAQEARRRTRLSLSNSPELLYRFLSHCLCHRWCTLAPDRGSKQWLLMRQRDRFLSLHVSALLATVQVHGVVMKLERAENERCHSSCNRRYEQKIANANGD